MKGIRTIWAAVLLLLAWGCFKDGSLKTNYVLKPLSQTLSTDSYEPLDGVQAYAFAADTNLYTVASYEDALNVTQPMQMVVAVDTEHRLYAYTQQELEVNLPNLYVSLPFRVWKEGNSYKDGNWSYYNEFYTPPVYVDCYVDPYVQATEGGEQTRISKLEVYAYAADTTAWYIATYDDAVNGKITSKTDPEDTRTIPSFQAYVDGDTGLYKMSVSSGQLMVVVADRSDQMYAYTQQSVDLETAESVTFPTLVFQPWQTLWIDKTDTGGWTIVNPAHAPEEGVTQNGKQ